MVIESISFKIVDAYFKLFKSHRFVTALITIVGLGVALTAFLEARKNLSEVDEALRVRNGTYAEQMESLQTVESSLKDLTKFVVNERQKLHDSQQLLDDLKHEGEVLKPVVEADRRAVESLLELQNSRAAGNLSKERWIGFGLGVLSSVLASILVAAVRLAFNYRRRTAKAKT